MTKKTSTDLDDRLLKVSGKWIYYIVYVLGFKILLGYLEARLLETFGEQFFQTLFGINFSVGVSLVALAIVGIISTFLSWYHDTIAAHTETTVDDEFIPLIDRAAKIVIYTLAFLMILDHFEVDINALIAVLGVGSLAVALAAQDTLANMYWRYCYYD